MRLGWQGAPPPLLLLFLWSHCCISSVKNQNSGKGVSNDERKKFGDRCESTKQCAFEGSVCQGGRCQCLPELPVTNYIDKCGQAVLVNHTCFFNDQCDAAIPQTECRDDICICRFEKVAVLRPDGIMECVVAQQDTTSLHGKYTIDPAMMGILFAMFLMFITICVVLRLFSRARWRENRTIFNTPNPRLMNASLLRENKILSTERRGSKGSGRVPSRQPSMASIRAHSPTSEGSRASSNISTKSNRSPPKYTNTSSATTPMLENVTVEN